jgi:hypothetical protein
MFDAVDSGRAKPVRGGGSSFPRQTELQAATLNRGSVRRPLHHPITHMANSDGRGGEQKRGPGRPGGKLRTRAVHARLWRTLGYFPEEIVGQVAPELTPPADTASKKLTVGQRRRRARKEIDRWERDLRKFEDAGGVEHAGAPSWPEQLRREAAESEALYAAAAANAGRLKRQIERSSTEPDDDPDYLRADAGLLRAFVAFSQARDRARAAAGVMAVAWHDLDEKGGFDDAAHEVADDLERRAFAIDSERASSGDTSRNPVTVRRVEDLTPEERERYGF